MGMRRWFTQVMPVAALVAASVAVSGCAGGQTVNGLKAADFFPDPRVRALAEASARGEADEVARLVSGGADANGVGRDGMVPLVWAMSARSHAGMRALLAAGASPNVAGPAGLKPLSLAAGSTDPELLRILLDAKGDPNARNSDGKPLLYTAVKQDQTANMQLLVDRGADVNAVDGSHSTPLMLAGDTGEWGQVAWLLEHGADPTIPDRTGGTVAYVLERAGPPRNAALRRDYDHAQQLLIARGVRFPAETPAAARQRAFAADNPIDAGRARTVPARRPTP